MSNSSWWRWAYSIAAVVLPIPPIPVTACTTVGPPDRSAASSSASSSARPVNPRTRAGIVHTRRSDGGTPLPSVGAGRCSGRGSAVSACSNAVSNSPGLRHRRGGHAAAGQPTPERVLARPMLQIPEHRRGALGVLAEQEHQPGNAPLLGGLVLQLGVGHLRPIAHRRPVPEPGDQHIHIRRRDRVPAHLRRLLVPRGEVRHVRHRVPSPEPPRPAPPRRTTAPPGTAATPTCATRTPAAAADSLGITHSIPALTHRENTNSQTDGRCRLTGTDLQYGLQRGHSHTACRLRRRQHALHRQTVRK